MTKSLLQRNTRTLLLWLPIVLLVSSGLFYTVLRMHASHMQEKQLLLKQQNVWTAFVASNGQLPLAITGEYNISPVSGTVTMPTGTPRDTSIYLVHRHVRLPFEAITGAMQWQGRSYLVTTYSSSTEISHLIIKVFATEAVILVLLLLSITLLNRLSAGRLWKPFFATIAQVEAFDITRGNALQLTQDTGITEFDTLNGVMMKMTLNVQTAYAHQKQFVENASHEIQTPLAIIRSKLELLINQPQLSERGAGLLADITDATNRLSQLNRTLLLLAKIENNQFPETEDIDVSGLVAHLIGHITGAYETQPAINTEITPHVRLHANRSLLEILFSNLVANAIIHNNTQAQITIQLQPEGFYISNTGDAPPVPTGQLFDRFKKGSRQQKATGLGLALVKQISQLYHYQTTYTYKNGWHHIAVTFGG